MPNYRASRAAGNRGGFMQGMGNAVNDWDVVTPTATLILTDTVDLILVPGGTTLLDLAVFNGDFDTGTTLQISLGYRTAQPDGVLTAVPAFFGSALTFLQGPLTNAAPQRFAFSPIYFPEDVYITATVTAAPTGTTGTPSITTRYLGVATGTR